MKVSHRQILILFIIALDSLKMYNNLGVSREDRQKLVDDIINQQSTELKDILKEK